MTRVRRPALAVLLLFAHQLSTSSPVRAGTAPGLPDISHAEWLVLGPFDNPAGSEPFENCVGYDTDFLLEIGGEAGARPVQGDRVAGRTWRLVRAADGTIDFESVFPNRDYSVAYASWGLSGRERAASDDGVKVWLNGTLVWANPPPVSSARQDAVGSTCRKAQSSCQG